MNLAEQINRVVRRVVSTGEQHTVVVEQEFPVGAAALWGACTEPERLARWFEPVTGDLRAGGRYRLEGSGTEGVIEHCEPPAALRLTWDHGTDRSRVVVTLTSSGPAATVLRLEHSAGPGEFWEEYGPAAGGAGWDGSLLALSLHLAGDRRGTPAEMAKLIATEQGRDFTARAVAAWQAAHIDSGAAPDAAAAAASRTLAFYTPA